MTLRRISYAEDEPDIRAVAELALTTVGGFEMDISADGVEALDRIPAYGPDLILLDVMMPGLDGPEVLRRLAEMDSTRDVPVILMTAKAQKHEIERYMALGAAGVIAKPFDPMTLHQQVQQIWDGLSLAREM